MAKAIEFEFEEDQIIKDVYDYIVSTYSSHYVDQTSGKQLLSEYEKGSEDAIGFCKVSGRKYLRRLGKKAGVNKLDILKTIHFCILLLHFLPEDEPKSKGDSV